MENQAITQRLTNGHPKRFNSRNAISSGILIVIGVFMVSLTPYDAHHRQQYPFARPHGVWRKYGHLWHDTDFESCLQNRICSYRQYN